MTHTPTASRPRRDTAPGQRATGPARRPRGHHVSRSAGRTPKIALRRDIQGLRGLAVTLVVLAHAGVPYVTGGYAGVDVFFVISGFLITAGLLKEAEHTGSLSLRRFYARRAVRILPLATLVALVTMASCRLFASKIRYTEFMHDALAGALFSGCRRGARGVWCRGHLPAVAGGAVPGVAGPRRSTGQGLSAQRVGGGAWRGL
ncbi:acyltransferase family protein [Streptomyces violaceusniger]|uniref:acyltransferase family protein n=1 Tax=Streptomyces violaceusniger TaxID=68280 RepID=UPI00382735BB